MQHHTEHHHTEQHQTEPRMTSSPRTLNSRTFSLIISIILLLWVAAGGAFWLMFKQLAG